MAISLGRVLLESGVLDVTWLGKATAIATEADVPLVHALARWRLVDSGALAAVLSRATGLPIVNLTSWSGSAQTAQHPTLPRALCHRLRVVPLRVEASGGVILGMSDPSDDDIVAQVNEVIRAPIIRALVDDDALERALRRVYARPVEELAPLAATPTPASVASAPWSPLVTRGESAGSAAGLAVVVAEITADNAALPGIVVSPAPVTMPRPAPLTSGPPTAFAAPPPLASDPVSFEGEASNVFTSRTIDEGRVPLLESTLQTVLPGRRAAPELPSRVQASDEAPTLQNNVLAVLRMLLVVDDAALGDQLFTSFGVRVKEARVIALRAAADDLGRRPSDVVIIVEPRNTIEASRQVAAAAAASRKGVFVVSNIADFARLKGVTVVAPPAARDGMVAVVERVVARLTQG